MKARPAGPLLHAIGSVVLRYPDPDVVAARARVVELAALLPDVPASASMRRFLGWWRDAPPAELAERYVATFDLGKRTSLYLTWYSLGDRRQRGQEFVRLKRIYEAAGRRLTGRELPDFLPLVLEFAAVEPEAGATVLAELQVGLELLRAALHDTGSVYAPAIDAIASDLAPLDAGGRAVVSRIAADGPPDEQVGLEPFGPPEIMPPLQGASR